MEFKMQKLHSSLKGLFHDHSTKRVYSSISPVGYQTRRAVEQSIPFEEQALRLAMEACLDDEAY
jgi:hypothetical protein